MKKLLRLTANQIGMKENLQGTKVSYHPVTVNWDNVCWVQEIGYTRIFFSSNDFIDVKESLEQINRMLEK